MNAALLIAVLLLAACANTPQETRAQAYHRCKSINPAASFEQCEVIVFNFCSIHGCEK